MGCRLIRGTANSEPAAIAANLQIPLQILAAVIAGILGGVSGYGKGLALKVQAQAAMRQMKIEQNTSHFEAIELITSQLAGIEENGNRLDKG